MNLQDGNLRGLMTRGSKEMMAERWWGMLERLGVRYALDQSYSRASVTLNNPVSKCPPTYHSEFINEDSALSC